MPFNTFNSVAKLPRNREGGTNTNAPNFTQVASTVLSTRYIGVAISDTGQYILSVVALTTGQPTSGVFYLSTNFGSSFNAIPGFTSGQNYYCSMSGNGQYMVMIVSMGAMWRSGNYGSTWQQVTNISGTQNWVGVSLSKNGKCCLANGNNTTNNLYISSNFDTANPTFTTVSVYATMNTSPGYNAVSNTGQYMIQLNWRPVDGFAISSDFGVSFSKLTFTNIGITGAAPVNICMTPDTNNIYYANYNEGLYKSTNLFSGSPMFTKITSATFTEQTWLFVVVSSDGTYVVASTELKTYYSKDSGVTWLLAYNGRSRYMAMSADAHYIVASNPDTNNRLFFSNT
jgi:hypothetical protein